MSNSDPELPESANTNEDPLTHEHGAHPVATGVGAMGGGATGGMIGLAMGGPVGGVIGAVIGAVAGGLGGSAVGESIDPTVENESWPGENAHLREEQAAATSAEGDRTTSLESALRAHGTELDDENGNPVAPDHEAIAAKAWSYYESEGKPDGHDLRHWLQAEGELQETTAAPSEKIAGL